MRPTPHDILEAVVNHTGVAMEDIVEKTRHDWECQAARTASVLLMHAAGWPLPTIACAMDRSLLSIVERLQSYLVKSSRVQQIVGHITAELDIELPATTEGQVGS